VDEDCENGLACAKGSCETFVGDNKPCATDRCLPELACTGPLASLKVCKTAPKLGEACDPDGAKAPAECDVAAMAYCDTGKKVCNAYQKIAPGEPCSLLALNETVCIGSVCAGSCQVLTADGGTCKSYLDCQAPAVCASGKCEMVSTSCQ
jgi:hypothetical protein